MRVVTLEEHFTVPAVVQKIDKAAIARRGFKPRKVAPGQANPMELLPEIGEKRLKSMDDAGISTQVLSNSGPGPDLMSGKPVATWRARSTIIWPASSARIPSASRALPHSRWQVPMRLLTNLSAR